MKKANLHFWKKNACMTELMRAIHWHLKMQSNVGWTDFEDFLSELAQYIDHGGKNVFDYAREHNAETKLKNFVTKGSIAV